MVVASWRPVGILVLLLLSGCAASSRDATPTSALREADQAAAEVSVTATPTTGVIRGVVVDEAIRPVAGVRVVLEGSGRNQTTNAAGAFGFDGLPPAVYFLSTQSPTHLPARVSVQVAAGDKDPEPVRIQLVFVAPLTPYIEALHLRMFVSAAVYAPVAGGYNSGATSAIEDGSWSYLVPISPNGTVAQFEYDWVPGSQLAENAQGHATTYTASPRKEIDDRTVSGPSPLVLRLNATGEPGTAAQIAGDIRANPSGGLPVGAMADQSVDCFVHIFHNLVPRADWQFGRDGEYPLPK
ncbi:MAG TPA: carboxypeptidase-like regulatory domain-containing protein [Candidatus Thermoplasmatota archaeon]|nr:carboxypeptidase-like regulatory domain-containing protein [Candidatus Thermoplasmatota archaeon]